MRRILLLLVLLPTLFSCRSNGVRDFWPAEGIAYDDIDAAKDRLARFAELAVAAPQPEALAAMDVLFDSLLTDPVAYYLYSDWMDAAFYSLHSPCRDADLYGKAVDRMVSDSVLTDADCAPFLQKREWLRLNRKGRPATLPGGPVTERTLVLVLDLGCPSCREALETLAADPRWSGVPKRAIGCGYGPRPDVPGWDYRFPGDAAAVFDPHLTPVYFVVAADGTVEQPYTLAI